MLTFKTGVHQDADIRPISTAPAGALVRQNEREAHEPADRVRHGAPCRLGPPDSYEPGPVVDELEDHAQLEQANQDQLLGRELGRPLDIQLSGTAWCGSLSKVCILRG